jgi:hypothetical protein
VNDAVSVPLEADDEELREKVESRVIVLDCDNDSVCVRKPLTVLDKVGVPYVSDTVLLSVALTTLVGVVESDGEAENDSTPEKVIEKEVVLSAVTESLSLDVGSDERETVAVPETVWERSAAVIVRLSDPVSL